MQSDQQARLFIGMSVPQQLSERIAELAKGAATQHGLRWAPPMQWHVTALFIGDRPAGHVPAILDGLGRVAEQHGPVELLSGQLVAMPGSSPTMLWIRFSPHEGFSTLHRALAKATGSNISPHSPLWPHITLARGGRVVQPLIRLDVVPSLTLDHLALFRSDPAPGGRAHISLGGAALSGTGPIVRGPEG